MMPADTARRFGIAVKASTVTNLKYVRVGTGNRFDGAHVSYHVGDKRA